MRKKTFAEIQEEKKQTLKLEEEHPVAVAIGGCIILGLIVLALVKCSG